MGNLDHITTNHIMKVAHSRHRSLILARFPELENAGDKHYLSLHKYITRAPYKYYSVEAYKTYTEWLSGQVKHDSKRIIKHIESNLTELNQAFLHLEEVNAYKWHDHFEDLGDYETIRFIERNIHPTYLKLLESTLSPFLRMIAFLSRLDRGKNTNGLDLFNSVEEVNREGLTQLTEQYVPTIRNGIGHGHITYLMREIKYSDKRGNSETYTTRKIIALIDDLLDVCNGIALALTMFQILNRNNGLKSLRQFLIDELKYETENPWWEVQGCVESEIPGKSQLLVYVNYRATLKQEIQFYAFQTGILAEYFARGYDRYFISFQNHNKKLGWLALHGEKLKKARLMPKATIDDYKGSIDNMLILSSDYILWLRRKFTTLRKSFKINWKFGIEDFRFQMGWPSISVRNAKIHRSKWGVVLNGVVIINEYNGSDSVESIRNYKRRIVRSALRRARSNTSRWNIIRYLPMGYTRLSVFQKDYRRRKLVNYGLKPDLIGTVEVKRLKRINNPDINGSTIEIIGKYRIAWNAAWLNEEGL